MHHQHWREERKHGQREEEGEETLDPSGAGRLHFWGLPQEASPTPAGISSKGQELVSYLDRLAFFLFFFLFIFLMAAPKAWGHSQARDGTCATAATRDAAVTHRSLKPRSHQGTRVLSLEYSGTRAKAPRKEKMSQHHLPGGPRQPQAGRQDISALQRRWRKARRRARAIQGHTASESPSPCKPRPSLFSLHPW